MKTNNKLLVAFLCCLLTLPLGLFYEFVIKANDIGNGVTTPYHIYDFKYDLTIDNYTYFLFLNDNYEYENLEPFEFPIKITYNNIYYDEMRFYYSENADLYILSLYSTYENRQEYIALYEASGINIRINGLQLYTGDSYIISLDESINYVLNIKNQVSGFYTFNQNLYPIDILVSDDYVFSNFSFNGQFAYNSDLPDFIDHISIPLDDTYQTLSFEASDSLGNSTAVAVFGSFNEENMDMRYLYLSTQYIDTMLYQYLKLNGLFSFVPPLETYSYNYWDLISTYVNIPVDIMSSIWSFSIFNTGVTILTFFATILSIALAIRIGRYYL